MAVRRVTVAPLTELEHLGVGIYRVRQTQLHVVILYRLAQGEARASHLRFHLLMTDEPATKLGDRLFWGQSSLNETNREFVAHKVALLDINPANIPFGFDSAGSAFDFTGKYLAAPPGKGLTCATFISAFFRSLGYPLLQEETWQPREDDAAWQRSMIDVVDHECRTRNLDCAEHIGLLWEDVGAVRLRPEEVTAGVISPQRPLAFPDARALAEEILADLAAA